MKPRSELRAVFRLGWPLALGQFGIMLTGVVDTLMVARLGVDELAASGLANMWQWALMSLGMGVVMGIDAEVSQAHGARDGDACARAFQRGIILAVLASIPISIAMLLTSAGLQLLGQAPHIALLAQEYNTLKLPTTLFFLLYASQRQYLQGRGIVAPATVVMWVANALNVVFNWVLIFGHWGVPPLGLHGAALASTLTTAVLPLGLLFMTRHYRLHGDASRPWDRSSFAIAPLLSTLRLGMPVGLQLTAEAWAFTLATFMAGWIDVPTVGAHQIVLNMASLAFMLPLGLSMGAATRVGNLIGAGDVVAMRRAVRAALVLGAASMSFSAIAFTTLRHSLPRLYTSDAVLIELAASILPIAGAFQLFDGLQVVACGALRGMGRTTGAAVIHLVGYYGVALPLAYALAFPFGLGLRGVWLGLALGLAAVAAAVVTWCLRASLRPLSDLSVGSHAVHSVGARPPVERVSA